MYANQDSSAAPADRFRNLSEGHTRPDDQDQAGKQNEKPKRQPLEDTPHRDSVPGGHSLASTFRPNCQSVNRQTAAIASIELANPSTSMITDRGKREQISARLFLPRGAAIV